MKIKELFKKDITRNIEGVVTIGNEDLSRKKQELEEYVCTGEIKENLKKFFSAYKKSIAAPTTNMGVWITGFFGSGKSHFLKILGYLLSNEIVDGKPSIDYFKDKISDPMMFADISLAAKENNLVILFNIDSKAMANAKNKQSSIMETMLNCFNEKIGFCGSVPWVAEMERQLSEEGTYEKFKEEFNRISGGDWVKKRAVVMFERDHIIEALSKVRGMSKDSALAYFNDSQHNFTLNIEEFGAIITKYCNTNKKRVIFLMDEVGQFIGANPSLMLGLQTIVEELGKQACGKAWVVVTSQQELKDMLEGIKRNESTPNDFSKIQGRFATRLMMSSSDANEVIKKRLLEKNDDAARTLGAIYNQQESRINNLLSFPDRPKWNGYQDEEQFIDDYPFVNYQYELLQKTFDAFRENGMSEGKHISSGERSLLYAFKKSAEKCCDQEIGILIPYNDFYETAEEFIDFNIKQVFSNAKKRVMDGSLQSFDIEVLKVLFMLKHVKEMEPTLERIATLMVTSLSEDKVELKRKIAESLERLISETLVQKNAERYEFLTNEEQDCNRQIDSTLCNDAEIRKKVNEIIYDKIFEIGKNFTYNGRYQIPLNKYIDDSVQGYDNPEAITVKIYTPWDKKSDSELIQQSMMGDNLIIDLSQGKYLEELTLSTKIRTFYKNNYDNASPSLVEILNVKTKEADEREKRAQDIIADLLSTAKMYQNGSLLEITTNDPKKRFDDGMNVAIKNKYTKIDYIKNFVNRIEDISTILRGQPSLIDIIDSDANDLALKEVMSKLKDYKDYKKNASLNSIISDFSKKPYGWRENDTRACIAKLLVNDKIRIIRLGEACDIHSASFIGEFTRGQNDDRYLLQIKEKISDNTIYEVKRIMKEAFGASLDNKENELFDGAREFLKNKLDRLNNIQSINGPTYPGRQFVEKAIKTLRPFVSYNDHQTFFNKIIEKKDDLSDIGENIDQVLNFYTTGNSQKKTWDEAEKISKYYRDNVILIPDLDQLSDSIKNIDAILSMPFPFEKMVDLSNLVNDSNVKLSSLEKKIKDEAKKVIEDNYKKILVEADEALKVKISNPDVKKELDDYIQNEKDLFENTIIPLAEDKNRIDSAKSKSYDEVKIFKEHLAEILSKDKVEGQEIHQRKVVQVSASDLIPVANKKITKQSEIDNILQRIKDYLSDLLADNDEIDIK